jgi:receptor protein-tyrosine kinase
MKTLLKDLRERFDIVLIDAPPLLPVTDAAILAAESDGAILISRHGKTTRDQVVAAVGRLESVEARLLGTVANWTPTRRSSYGYGYSYGYAPEVGRVKKDSSSPVKPSRKERRKQKKQSAAITVDARYPALLERNERVVRPEQPPRATKPPRHESPPAVAPHAEVPKGAGNRRPLS